MKTSSHRRIKIVNLLLITAGLVLIGRLFSIQVVRHDYYNERAFVQQTHTNPLVLKRGKIYFTEKDGNKLAAASVRSGYYMALRPSDIITPQLLYEELVPFVPELAQTRESFLRRAANKDDPFEIVAHRLGREAGEALLVKDIEGIIVGPEEWRIYPGENLAAHVLGFLGFQNESLEGRYGIERLFERALTGSSQTAIAAASNPQERSGGGVLLYFLQKGRSFFVDDVEEGDVTLTIEPTVQRFLESTLERARDEWQAAQAGGIIIEPTTGKILALAAKPDFDPNKYNEVKDLGVFVNPLIEHVFEMGSIFKPLTLAAALNQKRITPATTYYDKGFIEFDGARIENFDGKGRGTVDMQQVLNESLNTGAVFAMRQLGKDWFRQYIERYGFYEKSGVDLPGEVVSNASNLLNQRDIEYATASFGQGIALTPVALVSALSSLANGGKLMRPYVVERVSVPWGPDKITQPLLRRQVLDEETSRTISEMLVEVVDKALLGGTVKSEHYTIAAKTGTAQIPQQNGGGYSDQFLHSFFGYAPASNARFLVFLYLNKPQGIKYAAYSLGPAFEETMQFLLNYYDIPPDR
ncbi:MAG: penicillin-binding protein 2 [Parcubacteria group bacterium]|nr:penicillin-binding protein 2 [Parcubacteria group bacterium]